MRSTYILKVLSTSMAVFLVACRTTSHLNNEAQGFKVQMKAGEMLQLIAADPIEGALPVRQNYYKAAFPLADQFNYKRLGQLNITKKGVSDYDPVSFSFFSWPTPQAQQGFANHPDWAAIKATRPQGWDDLRVFNTTLQQDLNLYFDPTKYYTIAIAKIDQNRPEDYRRYLKGIEPAVNKAGGRFIYKIFDPTFESHGTKKGGPNQITLVEWETEDGFQQVQKMDIYEKYKAGFDSGLTQFEFYWLIPQSM